MKFKDHKNLSIKDKDYITHFIFSMGDFIPIENEYDYLAIKKYIRKILEIIEKEKNNED